MDVLSVFKFLLVLFYFFKGTKADKRLLLNDPSVIADRLARLESMVSYLNTTVKQQAETIENQKIAIQNQANNNVAVTYTVWGRKQCPNNRTNLVYSGFVGGGHFTHTGAAVDFLCLPSDPNYRKTTYSGQHAPIYGGEYDNNFFAPNANGNDIPCSVCTTDRASTVLMIPGKDTCYGGWNIEYNGYLGAHDYTFAAATSYICMHIHPEFVTGGSRNDNGKLVYPVVGMCGALECPPYINNYPLTCVVCSK